MRHEDLEYTNYRHVLDCIEHDMVTPSRADIAKRLGMSRTTVSSITNNLVAKGVLAEEKGMTDTRGRPGNPLGMNGDVWKVLGAAFYSTSWLFVVCNLLGTILDTYELPVEPVTPANLVSTLIDGLSYMRDLHSTNLLPAVGIGVPGVVDTVNGDILFAHDLAWNERFNVSSKVEETLGLKVFMSNRYCLAGEAEFKYANPENIKDFIYIGLGSGISCAIFVNGKLLVGDNHCAGRIAHIQVDPDGLLCSCGKRGCLLAVSNRRTLIDNVLQHRNDASVDSPLKTVPADELTIELVCRYADAGDSFARRCLDVALKPLIQVISILVSALHPKKIVIGGSVGSMCAYLTERIDTVLKIYPDYFPVVDLKVVQSRLPKSGAALGAASLVIEHKLELLYPILKPNVTRS